MYRLSSCSSGTPDRPRPPVPWVAGVDPRQRFVWATIPLRRPARKSLGVQAAICPSAAGIRPTPAPQYAEAVLRVHIPLRRPAMHAGRDLAERAIAIDGPPS